MGLSVEDVGHHVINAVTFDFRPGNGGECPADASVKEAQTVENFSGGGYSGARVARVDFLFNGNGGRYAFDEFHIRLRHPAEELSCIGRQTFCKTPLSLRKQRVEGK